MPSLPIPVISSLILGFLLLQMWRKEQRVTPLMGLLALCMVQGIIIALAQHYRVPGTRVLQPITAALLPAMGWVAFQITAVRQMRKTDWLHFGLPLVVVLALAINPYILDILIPLIFSIYGAAILWGASKGADALPRMRLSVGDLPRQIWQIIGTALILSAFTDVLIVVAQIGGMAWLQPWIISLYSTGMLLVIGGLSISDALTTAPAEVDDTPEPTVTDHDKDIVAKLDTAMRTGQLYLNPDLTLSQLSRKLLIPVKQLSGAINRVTGENVSRYINAARINAAQDALRQGENVTNAMLSSGFNTKSNFNREFLRVTGQSPSDWLASNS